MNTVKRIGRFLWLLFTGPLEWFLGVLVGFSIIWPFCLANDWIQGRQISVFSQSIVYGAAYLVAIVLLSLLYLFAHKAARILRALWVKAAHPL